MDFFIEIFIQVFVISGIWVIAEMIAPKSFLKWLYKKLGKLSGWHLVIFLLAPMFIGLYLSGSMPRPFPFWIKTLGLWPFIVFTMVLIYYSNYD